MIFLLLLGPRCEKDSRGRRDSQGMLWMVFLTATIGGIYTLTVSNSAMIGSSAIILAVLLRRLLPDPHTEADKQRNPNNHSNRQRKAGSSGLAPIAGPSSLISAASYKNLPADMVVAALFVFGESKLAVMETFGDADEDGISQTGQIFAGTLGAVSYYFFAKAGFGRSPDFEKYDRLRSMAEDAVGSPGGASTMRSPNSGKGSPTGYRSSAKKRQERNRKRRERSK